jgi:hypothetical protein
LQEHWQHDDDSDEVENEHDAQRARIKHDILKPTPFRVGMRRIMTPAPPITWKSTTPGSMAPAGTNHIMKMLDTTFISGLEATTRADIQLASKDPATSPI